MRRNRHRECFWRVAAVWHPFSLARAMGGGSGESVTYILWRCAGCTGPESLRSQVLTGSWTLADLDDSRELAVVTTGGTNGAG